MTPRVAFLAIAAALGAGCGRGDSSGSGPARVRVAMHPYLSYAPVLIAKEEGYFARQGLDVQLLSIGRSEQVLVALLSGDVDVWPGIYTPGFLRAIALGNGGVQFVGDKGYLAPDKCTYAGLVLRPGLDSSDAVKGLRRINMNRDGSTAYLMTRMLASRGIDDQSLEATPLPQEILLEALADGVVDGTSAVEPLLSRAVKVGTLWLRAERIVPGYQWGLLAYGRRLLTTDREVGVRFMAAYRQGAAQANLGQTPRNLEVLARATGMTLAELGASCWPTFRADGRIHLDGVLAYQAWARSRGFLDTTATPRQLYDSSFVVASDRILRSPE